MKSRIQLFAILLVSLCSLFAQSPEGFNYQAVIRNNAGEVLSNQSVGMRMSLRQGSANGSVVYRETFTKTTNSFGLIDLVIGAGNVTTGSFSTIDWANGPYFLETAVDQNGGSNYSVLGTSQLMSVPFAMYAANSASDGSDGEDGEDGTDGKSAYDIWLDAGNTGSEADFLASLVGAEGPAGADGADGEDGTGLTPSIQAEIDANTAKVGITTEQANAILTNSADPDVDETNEIQTLSISNDQLSLSNGGGSVTIPTSADNSITNEIQTLSISDDQVSLSNGGGSITLPSSADNSITNELQTISRADEFVVLSNSGGMASVEDDDADPVNELQTISRADEFVVLSNSGGIASIEDDDADPANEIQTLSISDDKISLSNGGGTVTIPTSADNSTINELNTTVVLNGTDLEVTDAGGTISADLSSLTIESDPVFVASDASAIEASDITNWDAVHSAYDSNGGFDDADADPANELQEISTDATPGNIAITDGATLILNVEDADADPENEIQDLELISNTLRITGNASATEISLGGKNYVGDIKHSFATGAHGGWYMLNGDALSTLPETAQAAANSIGIFGNLPDATDRFLKGNDGGESSGATGGSNSITISQANLEAFNLNVTETTTGDHNHGSNIVTSSNGAHSHSYTRNNLTTTIQEGVGETNTGMLRNTQSSNTNASGDHTHTVIVPNDGNHNHAVSVNTGGSGSAIPKPLYLSTNIFIYLGGSTLQDLQQLGKTNEEILAAGISPFTMWNDDNTILPDILGLDYNGSPITLQTFVDQGIDIAFLYNQFGQDLLDNTDVSTLELFNAGVTIAAMNGNGVALGTLIADGISLQDLYNASIYSLQDFKNESQSINDLLNITGVDLQALVDNTDFILSEYLAVGIFYDDLLLVGFSHQDLKDAGVTVANFIAQGFGFTEIDNNTDFTLTELRAGGIEGYLIPDLLTGYTYQQLKDDGVTVAEFIAEGYGFTEINNNTNFTLTDLRAGGYSITDLLTGYSHQLIKDDGVTVTQFLNALVPVGDLLNNTDYILTDYSGAAVGIADLYGAFPLQDLKDEYGVADALTVAGSQELIDDTDVTVAEFLAAGETASDLYGLTYEGGLIFYINTGDGSGLVTTVSSETTAQWSTIYGNISTNNNIGSGLANSNTIVAFDATVGIGAEFCLSLDEGGYQDWYMPSRSELEEMYNNLHTNTNGNSNGGFTAADYWSSSATSSSNARSISMVDGNGTSTDRQTVLRVRAIRAFN